MRSIARLGALSLAGAVIASSPAASQTLGTSARQMTPGSWKLVGFYEGAQSQDLDFTLQSGGPCAGGGAFNPGFPCGSGGTVTGKGDGGAVVLKAIAQPYEAVQYYASAGLGDYTLRVPNGGVDNVLTGDRPGFLYAFGAKAVLVPDTVAGPAIALDASVGWQRHHFNEVRPEATAAAGQIDQRLDVLRYQVALETSHRFDFSEPKMSMEPYGGLQWVRTDSHLKDLRGGGRVGGIGDVFTPFLGVLVPVFEHETLFAEAAFVGGYRYSAGLQVRFK